MAKVRGPENLKMPRIGRCANAAMPSVRKADSVASYKRITVGRPSDFTICRIASSPACSDGKAYTRPSE